MNLEGALSALPLFPLPEAVLFPGALLPLHVFEPRYRAMVKDVLASHRMLSIVRIADEAKDDDHPPIAAVAGLGTIVDYAELPGGRYHILVRGVSRVSLRELSFEPPYRRARAEVLKPIEGQASEDRPSMAALLSTATAFARVIRENDKDFELHLPKDPSPGQIADLCAHQLVIDGRERQSLLETLDAEERIRRVTEILAMQKHALSSHPNDVN